MININHTSVGINIAQKGAFITWIHTLVPCLICCLFLFPRVLTTGIFDILCDEAFVVLFMDGLVGCCMILPDSQLSTM